jgi:hypothetical protein
VELKIKTMEEGGEMVSKKENRKRSPYKDFFLNSDILVIFFLFIVATVFEGLRFRELIQKNRLDRKKPR